MSNATINIFDIGHYRNEDGPGIRTIVFFKGCPLRCQWCSNPFGLSREKQLAWKQQKCTNCGLCVVACPNGLNAIEEGKLQVSFDKCTACGKCIEICPTKARSIVGDARTVDDVFKEVQKDALFYRRSKGGITLSGGEVLLQYKAATELLKKCQDHLFLTTAVETSAYGPWEHLYEIAKYSDVVFVDFKHIDDGKHLQYVGTSNKLILENIYKLCEMSKNEGRPKIIIRRPIIKGINDDDETSINLAKFIAELPGHPEVNLIPYHNLGESKYEMIGKEYSLSDLTLMNHSAPEIVRIKQLTEKYAPQNHVSIGGGNIAAD